MKQGISITIHQQPNGFIVTDRDDMRNGADPRPTAGVFQSFGELSMFLAGHFDYRSGPLKGDKKGDKKVKYTYQGFPVEALGTIRASMPEPSDLTQRVAVEGQDKPWFIPNEYWEMDVVDETTLAVKYIVDGVALYTVCRPECVIATAQPEEVLAHD